MRLAIIDLGTNSVRFDIHQLSLKSNTKVAVQLLHREKLMIRLGEAVFVTGTLKPESSERALQVFQLFKHIAEQFRVDKTIAFATSALREAKDRDKLIHLIHQNTGIEIRVISGSEEARLIALGILENEKFKKPLTQQKWNWVCIDIGGGSTELSFCTGRKIHYCISLPIGTARIEQIFLKKTPPTIDAIHKLRHYVRNTLATHLNPLFVSNGQMNLDEILGSSGTVRTLGKILAQKQIILPSLSKLINKMAPMTTQELLEIPGMEAKRADMILGGSVILEAILQTFQVVFKKVPNKIRVTEFALRDGILAEEKQLYEQTQNMAIRFHLPDIYAKAKSFGVNENSLAKTLYFAENLFDKLQTLHKLSPQWKNYLLAASSLKDTGKAIALRNHTRHAAYIVAHGDFASISEQEAYFLSQLCLHQSQSKLTAKDIALSANKTEFFKVLALLQVVDAFDLFPSIEIDIKKITISAHTVLLAFSAKPTTGLEIARLEKKKILFERVFHRSLVFKTV